MPTVQCPLPGFEAVTVTYPDRWTIGDRDKFFLGVMEAPKNASPQTKEVFGAIALCQKIEGLGVDSIQELDLYHWQALWWIVEEVYYGSFLEALTTPPNS